MQITHVVTSPRFHGTERYVTDLAPIQASWGHEVTVVGGPRDVMAPLLGDQVRWLPGSHLREAVRSLASLGRQDVVHAHLFRSERAAAIAAPINRGRRFATQHLVHRVPPGPLGVAQEAILNRLTAATIAVSQSIADSTPRSNVVVIRNAVHSHLDHVRIVSDKPGIVLVAQRLAPEKDTTTAIRAWATSGLAAAGWRMQVAGDGPQKPELVALAAALGVGGSVDLLGWRQDIYELMSSADLLLAPPAVEPLGLSVLEAMARALPVVASTAPGHLETVGRDPEAALFPVGDAEACAAQLVALAQDPKRRQTYGSRLQRLQSKDFNLDLHATEVELLYRANGAGRH